MPDPATDSAALAQQRPAQVLEPLRTRLALGPQAGALGAADLIDGLVQMGGDMEAIQNVQGLPGLGGEDVQVGLPQVAANEPQALDPSGPKARRPRRSVRSERCWPTHNRRRQPGSI